MCLPEAVIEGAAASDWHADVEELFREAEECLRWLDLVGVESALIFADGHGTIARHFAQGGTPATFDQIQTMALAALDDAMRAAIEPLIHSVVSLRRPDRPG